jgi:RNA polymerase sigma factor (sigma-70 family)
VNDQTDSQLLDAWVEARAERAFAELVRRHLDFVFSAAWRMVGDSHLAQDVTQSVFIALARDAARISNRCVLSGWLHGAVHNIAAQTIRTDARRRAREQEAAAMNELLATESNPTWELIAPHLDGALRELSEPDRDAVLLRYFENKSLREVGQALGTSDDTAQKRVSRAVERLREVFAARGVTAGVGGLMAVVSTNAVQAAPVGLADTISTAAALGATSIAGSAAATATKTIAMTTLQKAIVGTVLAVAVGTEIYQAHETGSLRTQMQTIEQQQGPLAKELGQLTSERDDAARSLAGLQEAPRISTGSRDLLRLRAEAARLHSAIESARQSAKVSNETNDPVAATVRSWLAGLDRIEAAIKRTPEAVIPEFQLLQQEDWWWAAKQIAAGTDERKAVSKLVLCAENRFVNEFLKPALRKYLQAHDSQFPTDLAQLRPLFSSPVDDAVLERWKIAPTSEFKGQSAQVAGAKYVITQKAPDEANLGRYLIGPNAAVHVGNNP